MAFSYRLLKSIASLLGEEPRSTAAFRCENPRHARTDGSNAVLVNVTPSRASHRLNVQLRVLSVVEPGMPGVGPAAPMEGPISTSGAGREAKREGPLPFQARPYQSRYSQHPPPSALPPPPGPGLPANMTLPTERNRPDLARTSPPLIDLAATPCRNPARQGFCGTGGTSNVCESRKESVTLLFGRGGHPGHTSQAVY
ncbi:hypothetical protein LY76DRAFT_69406 [Colletotrichum caudatum]|nr:hypothetical protein LY76DRAFT_69406 [Colletotrichum caudatum]